MRALWRGRETVQMLVAWRAPRDEVRAALEAEDVPAAVGPAERGWTLVRLLAQDGLVVEPRGRPVLDLLDDLARTLRAPAAICLLEEWNERELLVLVPGRSAAAARIPGLSGAAAPSRQDWVEVLRALDALPALDAVLAAATLPEPVARKDWTAVALADRRHRAVAQAAGLPEALLDPGVVAAGGIEREVVVARGVEPPDVGVVAAALGVPLQVAELDDTTVVAYDPVDGRPALPIAGGLGSGRRTVLLLWRQADARGYQVVRRQDVVDAHVWDTAWEVCRPSHDLGEDRDALAAVLAPDEGDATALVEHAGADRTPDLLALRSLLRRRPDGQVLRELCDLLGIDPRVAAVVEGEQEFAELPGARTVASSSSRSAIWAAATTPRADDPWVVRAGREKPWWWRLADLAWVVVAVVWAVSLWSGGGALARVGAGLLVFSAVWSLYDAVTPAAPPPAGSRERSAGSGS